MQRNLQTRNYNKQVNLVRLSDVSSRLLLYFSGVINRKRNLGNTIYYIITKIK